MDTPSVLAFLGLVALGSYIQTVSGFAIALIITGGVTAFGLASIAFTANVVSIVAIANVATAVHGRRRDIDSRVVIYATAGVLLFSGIGLWLLNHLSDSAVSLLETLLGVVILGSGALLVIHPHPRDNVSSNGTHLVAGAFGGLLSGTFGAGGPPLVLHLYRQPLPFPIIRTTLLAVLGTMPLIRIGLEGAVGHITADILKLSALAVPVSITAAIVARRYPPPLPDQAMRRFAFGLLCVIGLSLIIGSA